MAAEVQGAEVEDCHQIDCARSNQCKASPWQIANDTDKQSITDQAPLHNVHKHTGAMSKANHKGVSKYKWQNVLSAKLYSSAYGAGLCRRKRGTGAQQRSSHSSTTYGDAIDSTKQCQIKSVERSASPLPAATSSLSNSYPAHPGNFSVTPSSDGLTIHSPLMACVPAADTPYVSNMQVHGNMWFDPHARAMQVVSTSESKSSHTTASAGARCYQTTLASIPEDHAVSRWDYCSTCETCHPYPLSGELSAPSTQAVCSVLMGKRIAPGRAQHVQTPDGHLGVPSHVMEHRACPPDTPRCTHRCCAELASHATLAWHATLLASSALMEPLTPNTSVKPLGQTPGAGGSCFHPLASCAVHHCSLDVALDAHREAEQLATQDSTISSAGHGGALRVRDPGCGRRLAVASNATCHDARSSLGAPILVAPALNPNCSPNCSGTCAGASNTPQPAMSQHCTIEHTGMQCNNAGTAANNMRHMPYEDRRAIASKPWVAPNMQQPCVGPNMQQPCVTPHMQQPCVAPNMQHVLHNSTSSHQVPRSLMLQAHACEMHLLTTSDSTCGNIIANVLVPRATSDSGGGNIVANVLVPMYAPIARAGMVRARTQGVPEHKATLGVACDVQSQGVRGRCASELHLPTGNSHRFSRDAALIQNQLGTGETGHDKVACIAQDIVAPYATGDMHSLACDSVALPVALPGADGGMARRVRHPVGPPRWPLASVAPGRDSGTGEPAGASSGHLGQGPLSHPRLLGPVAHMHGIDNSASADPATEVLVGPVTWASPSSPGGMGVRRICIGNSDTGIPNLGVGSTDGSLCHENAGGSVMGYDGEFGAADSVQLRGVVGLPKPLVEQHDRATLELQFGGSHSQGESLCDLQRTETGLRERDIVATETPTHFARIERGNETLHACDNGTLQACDNETLQACDNETLQACEHEALPACESGTLQIGESETLQPCEGVSESLHGCGGESATVQPCERESETLSHCVRESEALHNCERANETLCDTNAFCNGTNVQPITNDCVSDDCMHVQPITNDCVSDDCMHVQPITNDCVSDGMIANDKCATNCT
jgi:hypothetical protein